MSVITYQLEDNFILSELVGHATPDTLKADIHQLHTILDDASTPVNVIIDLSTGHLAGDVDLTSLPNTLRNHRKIQNMVLVPTQQVQASLNAIDILIACSRETGLDMLGYWG